jgi:hypothetical protein
MKRLSQLIIFVSILSFLGCASIPSRNIVDGVYTSPNGGFTYKLPGGLDETRITENILPQGGNVQFFQWSHFKRIDYVSFRPTIEKEIQNDEFRKKLLKNFAMGTFVPSIAQHVPGTEVKKTEFRDNAGVSAFYVSMLLPQASTKSLNGKRLDACRCMLIHATAEGIYALTASAGVDTRDTPDHDKAFEKTEEWLNPHLLQFVNQVKIQ